MVGKPGRYQLNSSDQISISSNGTNGNLVSFDRMQCVEGDISFLVLLPKSTT